MHSFGVGLLYNFIALIGSFLCHLPGWLAKKSAIISTNQKIGEETDAYFVSRA